MNEQRIHRMLRELRADPVAGFLERAFCEGHAEPEGGVTTDMLVAATDLQAVAGGSSEKVAAAVESEH